MKSHLLLKNPLLGLFFMRASDRPQFPVTLANHIIGQRTNVIVALSVDYGFGQRKMGLRNINAKGKQCEI